MEKERAQLIKKIYELGFEVGLKNHSEIGWVIRDYNALAENARKLGIKSPELYYQDGRIKGRASREKGDEVNEKNADIVKKVTISEIKNETCEIERFEVLQMQQKPGFNEFLNSCKADRTHRGTPVSWWFQTPQVISFQE